MTILVRQMCVLEAGYRTGQAMIDLQFASRQARSKLKKLHPVVKRQLD